MKNIKTSEVHNIYYKEAFEKAIAVKEKKMHDYGIDINCISRYGLEGLMHDIARKFYRLESILIYKKQPMVKDELLNETFLDLMNFAMDGMRLTNKNKK